MGTYDPLIFAAYLYDAYDASRFKSRAELAKAAGLTRSAVASLISAKPQSLTGNPSQPKPETVIALAKALNWDVNEALLVAGHAPLDREKTKPSNFAELVQALGEIGIEIAWAAETDFENYTEDDFEELKERIAADTTISIRRKTR